MFHQVIAVLLLKLYMVKLRPSVITFDRILNFDSFEIRNASLKHPFE